MVEAVKLSRAAAERLQKELDLLRSEGRAAAKQAVLDARAMGSILENGDYTAAKEEERLLEDRIGHIEGLFERAVILTDAELGSSDGSVTSGSKVKIVFLPEGSGPAESFSDDDIEEYLYGESVEKGDLPVCTPTSPLGSVLHGAKEGDMLRYRTPAGRVFTVKILEVA